MQAPLTCVCVCVGVAEQFAIAEAKLRAWSSVDGDDSNDDSYDEDFLPANEPSTQSTGTHAHVHPQSTANPLTPSSARLWASEEMILNFQEGVWIKLLQKNKKKKGMKRGAVGQVEVEKRTRRRGG